MRRVISSMTDYAFRRTLGHTKRESDRKYRVAKNDSQQVRAVANGQLTTSHHACARRRRAKELVVEVDDGEALPMSVTGKRREVFPCVAMTLYEK